jgi:hypothetical protein
MSNLVSTLRTDRLLPESTAIAAELSLHHRQVSNNQSGAIRFDVLTFCAQTAQTNILVFVNH